MVSAISDMMLHRRLLQVELAVRLAQLEVLPSLVVARVLSRVA
jgi:hypothetical protein